MHLEEVAVGVSLRGTTLTTVTRRTSTLLAPRVEQVAGAEDAAQKLNALKYELRRDGICDPQAFVDASTSHVAGHMVEITTRLDGQNRDQIVDPIARAWTYSHAGIEYANRWSELADKFLARLQRVELLVPSDQELAAELVALVRADREGKISYPLPTEVADKIGRYPAKVVAAVLSTIDAPPPGKVQRTQPLDYDPYAAIG